MDMEIAAVSQSTHWLVLWNICGAISIFAVFLFYKLSSKEKPHNWRGSYGFISQDWYLNNILPIWLWCCMQYCMIMTRDASWAPFVYRDELRLEHGQMITPIVLYGCNYSPMPNFNGGLVNPPLKLRYGWVIIFDVKPCFVYLSMSQSRLVSVIKRDPMSLYNMNTNSNSNCLLA